MDPGQLSCCGKVNYYCCCHFETCLDDSTCFCLWDCFDCENIQQCCSIVLIVLCLIFPPIAILFFIAGGVARNPFVKAASFWSAIVGIIMWICVYDEVF